MTEKKPQLKLRLFNQRDGALIAGWITDPAYKVFFRNLSVLPTFEDCINYPTWSQNIIMMIDAYDAERGGCFGTVGMACGYHMNYRNRTVKAGLLIREDFHGRGVGHNAQVLWVDYLFHRLNFRKVIVENLDEHFTVPYTKTGFVVEGRFARECELDGEFREEIRMACFKEDWTGGVK